ncbi:MAG: cupin domain-containing protein [Tepidisphaera sp.]|nr:cupin domain-containing protein [Tepidisphaera sp.]
MYQHHVNAEAVPAQPLELPGVSIRVLWNDPATGAMTVITQMAPGSVIPRHSHTHADETVFVLEGDFIEDGRSHGPGTYFVGKKQTPHGPHATKGGCRVLTQFSATLDFVGAD